MLTEWRFPEGGASRYVSETSREGIAAVNHTKQLARYLAIVQ